MKEINIPKQVVAYSVLDRLKNKTKKQSRCLAKSQDLAIPNHNSNFALKS